LRKTDRIPDAWPVQMSDLMAAAYCDLSLSQFRALVDADKLPGGRKIFGTVMVRWLKADLDRVILAEHGRKVDRAGNAEVAPTGVVTDLDRAMGMG